MRRLFRILLNAATAVSLVLFVAVLPVWFMSVSPPEEILYLGSGRPWAQVSLWNGDVLFAWGSSATPEYRLPLRLLILATLVLPAARILATRWRQRVARVRTRLPISDVCAACGYDLRATPARCPECGTIPQ